MTALAKQLAEHPSWRWLPGMRVLQGPGLPPGILSDNEEVICGGKILRICPGDLPDIHHPGTLGGMLVLLGPPTTLPCDWICRWHAGEPLGELLAKALLQKWVSEGGV